LCKSENYYGYVNTYLWILKYFIFSMTCMYAFGAAAIEVSSPTGESLGTLFYSRAERRVMVLVRNGGGTEVISSVLTVTGIVKRDGGKSTVWINDMPVPEGQSVPLVAQTTITASGVTLDGQHLRVGETLDTSTHWRTDLVTPGSVSQKLKK
jgi:hypothetical protein